MSSMNDEVKSISVILAVLGNNSNDGDFAPVSEIVQ